MLNDADTRIVGTAVLDQNSAIADEPTIGALVGNEFLYIANSQWEKHDDAGVPRTGVKRTAPVILALRLRLADAEGDDRREHRGPRQVHETDLLAEATFEFGIELGKPRSHSGENLGPKLVDLGILGTEALLKLRVEPRKVDLVEFHQIGPVGSVHGVEPVDEFVGGLLTYTIVEGLGQSCGHGHRRLLR